MAIVQVFDTRVLSQFSLVQPALQAAIGRGEVRAIQPAKLFVDPGNDVGKPERGRGVDRDADRCL